MTYEELKILFFGKVVDFDCDDYFQMYDLQKAKFFKTFAKPTQLFLSIYEYAKLEEKLNLDNDAICFENALEIYQQINIMIFIDYRTSRNNYILYFQNEEDKLLFQLKYL